MLARMLKHCEASRGHISRLLRLGCTSASWQTSATEYTVRSEIFSIRTTALESRALFRCVQSAQVVLTLPPVRGCKFNFADCYPVVSDRVCQVVLFALL